MARIVIYTDGGARGNPGPAAIGFIVYLEEKQKKKIHSFAMQIGRATNNLAEYQAVEKALKWVIKNNNLLPSSLDIYFYLDSNLVVNQLNGLFKIKNQAISDVFFRIKIYEGQIKRKIFYQHIFREQNLLADKLVNQALDG